MGFNICRVKQYSQVAGHGIRPALVFRCHYKRLNKMKAKFHLLLALHRWMLNLPATVLLALSVTLLVPLSHAQSSLVFIESPTGWTETLNGTPIGNWSPNGSVDNAPAFYNYDGNVGFPTDPGDVLTPGGPYSYIPLLFVDPLNAGNYVAIAPNGNESGVYQNMTAAEVSVVFGGSPVPSLADASSYIPYSESGAQVWNGTSEVNVNITVEAVPEPSTLALAGLGGLSLLFLRRRK